MTKEASHAVMFILPTPPPQKKTLHSSWGFVASKIGWLIALQFSWIASMEKLWKRSKKFSPLTLQKKKKNQLIDSECLRERASLSQL